MGLFDGEPRAASVVTTEQSEFVSPGQGRFSQAHARELRNGHGHHARPGQAPRKRDRKIESLALLDVYGRVARVLLEFAEDIDGRKVIKGVARQDIAKMIGASGKWSAGS